MASATRSPSGRLTGALARAARTARRLPGWQKATCRPSRRNLGWCRPATLVLTLATAALVGTSTGALAPAGATVHPGPAARARGAAGSILLALGDSLAAGYQPSDGHRLPPVNPATGLPDGGYPGGYAGDLAAHLRLRLVDLACPGETTSSIVAHPAQAACRRFYEKGWSKGSQLGAALAFLAGHRGQVRLVTFDLGANDVDGCLSKGQLDLACLGQAMRRVADQLPPVLARLRRALRQDDPAARLVAMSYYDPFLGLAYDPGGAKGLTAAGLSVAGADAFNAVLEHAYHRLGIPVANVAGAFSTGSALPLTTFRDKRLAKNVALVCRLTWMCPAPSSKVGQDIHHNRAGYTRIASAFEALGARL